MAAHRRILSALAVAGLAAVAVLGTSILLAIAAVAVGAFAVLQVTAWWQRRRSAFADWRTWPPGHDPWADRGDPVAGQHEGSAYRPGYGFLPGPEPGRGAQPGRGVQPGRAAAALSPRGSAALHRVTRRA
jgi:hypothetical protein